MILNIATGNCHGWHLKWKFETWCITCATEWNVVSYIWSYVNIIENVKGNMLIYSVKMELDKMQFLSSYDRWWRGNMRMLPDVVPMRLLVHFKKRFSVKFFETRQTDNWLNLFVFYELFWHTTSHIFRVNPICLTWFFPRKNSY